MSTPSPMNLGPKQKVVIGIGAAVGLFVLIMLMDGFFILRQTESALVIRFGEAYGSYTEPGLKIKAPFIDEVVRIDNRVLDLDETATRRGVAASQQEVILRDRRRIVVDTITRYRISEPLVFFRAARTINRLEELLRNRTNAAVRDEMAKVVLTDLLAGRRIRSSVLAPGEGVEEGSEASLGPDGEPLPIDDETPAPDDAAAVDDENPPEEGDAVPDPSDLNEDGVQPDELAPEDAEQARADREKIMQRIREQVAADATDLGVTIVDIRIRRADLPNDVFENVLGRMVSERQRVAARLRAEGGEEALRIRSEADKEVEILRSEGQEEADRLRGEGERESFRILGEAFSQDAEFYDFFRSMIAYRASLADPSTTMVLDPTGEFFKYFNQLSPAPVE